jgi:hypothetical protein
LEELGVDEGIILKCVGKKCDGDIGWINLAQDRHRWELL